MSETKWDDTEAGAREFLKHVSNLSWEAIDEAEATPDPYCSAVWKLESDGQERRDGEPFKVAVIYLDDEDFEVEQ